MFVLNTIPPPSFRASSPLAAGGEGGRLWTCALAAWKRLGRAVGLTPRWRSGRSGGKVSGAQKTTEPRSSRVTFVAAGGAGSSLHEKLPAQLVIPDCAYLLWVYCDWLLPPRGRDKEEVSAFDPASFWKKGCDWLVVRLLSGPDSPRSARVGLTGTRESTVLCPSECGAVVRASPSQTVHPWPSAQAPSVRAFVSQNLLPFPRLSFTSLPI